MLRHKSFVLLYALIMSIALSGCVDSRTALLGGVPRKTLTEEERAELFDQLSRQNIVDGEDLYNESGIIINSSRFIEISSWKLNNLAAAYEQQNEPDYITDVAEIDNSGEYWMAHRVKTADFEFDVRLSGDEDIMTLEITIDGEYPIIIAPRGCVINGILKDTTIFKGSEPEKGRFVITAAMSDFEALGFLGITFENIASIAWLLTAINTETHEMRDFMLASSFPVSGEWAGLQVAENYSVASGIVMWIARLDDAVYLCTFNGAEEKIFNDITVEAVGNLISTLYTLDVSSGECSYMLLGYDVERVSVFLDDILLFAE